MQLQLYELTDEYKELMDMLCNEEEDKQTIRDTMEGLEGEIEDKADGCAKIMRSMHAEAEALKKEEERLHRRRIAIENGEDWLRGYLQANLEFIGKTKFKTALFSFSVVNNGGKQPIFITDNLGEIPNKYLIQREPVVDKDAVRRLLEEKEVEWAHFEPRGRRLNIR